MSSLNQAGVAGGIEMKMVEQNVVVPFVVEESGFEGVKRIVSKVARDIEKVSGKLPDIVENYGEHSRIILCATLGKSALIETLSNKELFDTSSIENKREVYKIQLVKNPFEGVEEALVICGSDKRGTIYGAFALSEYIGVSPLCYWGDVEPATQENLFVSKDIEIVSREPSVKYRGFFINDEWPCFGNWTFSHFNGFTAQMYDHVFELLLRLKGNYLWPAMWSSSFPLDGPGSLNEELADIYGVVIGYSHHEPCLRASEEWDKVRGIDSIYGNEWNFYTNREGLIQYWKDALVRSGKYENLITIGMRGERDTSMLGSHASLQENIDLLKDIITTQRELIRQHVNPNVKEVPQLLALYKEVEAYYYGDETTQGLKDWEELDGVICMLCDDNFGHMRTLPTKEIRNRNGGFGMYYHFDYHGDPISYEWMPSTPFSKTWDQMSMAYEYGIKDVWIVNVGDLKGNEVSLAYFLSLAYDFDKWGTSAPNSWNTYLELWMERTFPKVNKPTREKMIQVLTQYININALRRPEALHANVYHPCHYLETDRMLHWAQQVEDINEAVYEELHGQEKDAYFSMIYFPAKASINLLRMHLYAGKNEHYAKQGKTIANIYADKVTECIAEDRRLVDSFATFREGKWKGMELEQHIGFVKWNEDNCRYPLRMQVEPAYKPRLTVSRKDSRQIAVKNYGHPEIILVDDFLYEGNTEVILEIANDGIGTVEYTIDTDCADMEGEGRACEWLTFTNEGSVSIQEEVVLKCDRQKLPKETQTVRLFVKDKETTVAVIIKGKAIDTTSLLPMTFLPNNGVVVMEANHYASKKDVAEGGFKELRGYGRSGCSMKVFPTTINFADMKEKPSLTYRFLAEQDGEYGIELWTAPMNLLQDKAPIHIQLTTEAGTEIIEIVPSNFIPGIDVRWEEGVLKQIKTTKTTVILTQGIKEIMIGAMEAGVILQRILIYPTECLPKESYLGPQESYYKGVEGN